VAAEHAGIRPLLLLNKADLIDDENAPALNACWRSTANWATRCWKCRPPRRWHAAPATDARRPHQRVRRPVGVGKSSLVNSLLPDVGTRVGDLSEWSGQGTHTTTTARLFHFPAAAT
jgi:ribosome biogenesis GTPase